MENPMQTWRNHGAYTRSDIYQAAFYLRQRLPAELVPGILYDGDFLERQGATFAFQQNIQVDLDHSPSLVYWSPALDTRVCRAAPVTSVEFRVAAYDQAAFPGPEPGWWTYFTAAIVRREDHEASEHDQSISFTEQRDHAADGRHGPWFPAAEADAAEEQPREPRVHVWWETKVEDFASTPSKNTKIHTPIFLEGLLVQIPKDCLEVPDVPIVWRADSPVLEEREFVASIRPGDRILVRAWAKFPSAQNIVQALSVTMSLPVVVR